MLKAIFTYEIDKKEKKQEFICNTSNDLFGAVDKIKNLPILKWNLKRYINNELTSEETEERPILECSFEPYVAVLTYKECKALGE